MKDTRHITSVHKVGEEMGDYVLRLATPGERMEMVWEITMDAWSFVQGEKYSGSGEAVIDAESRLPRHIGRVIRRGR